MTRERNRLNRGESINRTRAQEILFIRTHYECAQVAFDMCLHLFFIHFYLRFLLASHLRHASLALLFSFSQLFHLMRCELKRREVCNTWRLELSFMRLGCCPAPFWLGLPFMCQCKWRIKKFANQKGSSKGVLGLGARGSYQRPLSYSTVVVKDARL